MRSFITLERRLHAFVHVGVADVEDRNSTPDASVPETASGARRSTSALGMFSSSTSTPRCRANRLISSSAVKAASTLRSSKFLAGDADMLDQIAERNRLGDLERALDLIHHLQPLAFHRLGNVDDRVRPRAAPDIVACTWASAANAASTPNRETSGPARRSGRGRDNPGAAARRRSPPPESPRAESCRAAQPSAGDSRTGASKERARIPNILWRCLPCVDRPRLRATRRAPRIAATSPIDCAIFTWWPRAFSSAIVSGEKPRSITS